MGVFDYIKNKKKDFDAEKRTGLKTYSEPKEKEEKSLIEMESDRRKKEKRTEFFGKVKAKGQTVGMKAKEGIKAKFLQARKNVKEGKTAGLLGGTGKSQSIFTGGTLSGKPNPIFTSGFGSSGSPFASNKKSSIPKQFQTTTSSPFDFTGKPNRRRKSKGRKIVMYVR
jgi:hypothetical protein